MSECMGAPSWDGDRACEGGGGAAYSQCRTWTRSRQSGPSSNVNGGGAGGKPPNFKTGQVFWVQLVELTLYDACTARGAASKSKSARIAREGGARSVRKCRPTSEPQKLREGIVHTRDLKPPNPQHKRRQVSGRFPISSTLLTPRSTPPHAAIHASSALRAFSSGVPGLEHSL